MLRFHIRVPLVARGERDDGVPLMTSDDVCTPQGQVHPSGEAKLEV